MVTDPADVVAAIIKGVRANRKKVFADRTEKKIHYITRIFPWIIPILTRRMDEKIN
jgi:aspartate oxidase